MSETDPLQHATAALVAESGTTSAFARHKRGLPNLAAVATHGVFLMLLPIFVLLSGGIFGWPGFLLSGAVALAGALPILNRTLVFGNARLRRRILERIGPAQPGESFVGLLHHGNNTVWAKYFTLRAETDDNAGFLSIQGDTILIRTEEKTIALKRDSVRSVEREAYVELPYLHWITLEHFAPEGRIKLYVSSREGRTLRDMRRSTERLYYQLKEWFVEAVLAEAGLLEATNDEP